MSAAIMGPAVSTFFNPQFSTPFSGAATPFVYLVCLIAILIAALGHRRDGPGAAERRRLLHLRDPRARSAGRVRHRRSDVRRLRLLPPAEVGLIGVLPAEYVPRRVRFKHPLVDHRPGPGGADDAAGVRGHPLVACGRRWSCSRSRCIVVVGLALIVVGQGRPRRADAAAAQPGGLAERLQRTHHRVRVRRAELRRLRGRGHARRRGQRAAPGRPARRAHQRPAGRADLRLLHLGRGQRARHRGHERARPAPRRPGTTSPPPTRPG